MTRRALFGLFAGASVARPVAEPRRWVSVLGKSGREYQISTIPGHDYLGVSYTDDPADPSDVSHEVRWGVGRRTRDLFPEAHS